jgi:O-acetylhomoserine/O-acetylserine sulfhydrylase-like pyridoxal-dependent enzyme
MDWSKVGLGTASVWAGEEDTFPDGATQVPLVHSAAFGYPSLDEWGEVALGREDGHIYLRASNPTVRVFEDKVRMLEGAEAATSFSTGMAAISNALFTLVEPGDRVVSIKDNYGGTSKVFLEMLPQLKFAHMAANLGSVSTLAGPPSTTSHVELTVDQRQALDIPESLIRYSVEIENPEDLIADLEQALAGV